MFFSLLACPYTKMLADKILNQRPNEPLYKFKEVHSYEGRKADKGGKTHSWCPWELKEQLPSLLLHKPPLCGCHY